MRSFAAAVLVIFAGAAACNAASAEGVPTPASLYFIIQVVDDRTGRGVPLVELRTTNQIVYVTDSGGLAAIHEPGLMGQKVFFTVGSHGYEYPKDGFGMRGVALDLKPGGQATIKIKRLNIAERLYRVTGQGIYADTVLAGRTAPIAEPLLNGKVMGQDSVQSVIYRGKIFWFWGDTQRPSYPLGHFGMAGATSAWPGKGGLDPSVGINLTYFVGPDGFSRPMVHLATKGMWWADGLMVLGDASGRERLIARCNVHKSLSEVLERNLLMYDDASERFEPLQKIPLDAPLYPCGHPFRYPVDGVDYFYFPCPYATMRVRADIESVKSLATYEGFTCLAPGSRYDKAAPKLDRDAAGNLVWAWKKDTEPVSEIQQAQLIKAGKMRPGEACFRLLDAETKTPVVLHGGSMAWNAFRRRWILIAVQHFGKPSLLGEVWYAEADKPEGPWRWAHKIVTHDRYSFYNPKHHPFFDQEGGRVIYFEGTYVTTFSRDGDATPRYDYNQVMYRLDLSDPRLVMPAEK